MTWQPVDIITLVLTIAMALSLLITVLVPLALKKPISDERSKSLAVIAEKVLLIIAGYIGFILGGGGE